MMLNGYYGNFEAELDEASAGRKNKQTSITPADLVFGHRFWADQQTMEYLLEFLNVFAGFSFELGIADARPYQRKRRLGLRRFVFLPDDQNAHGSDRRALAMLESALRLRLSSNAASSGGDPVEAIRLLVRSFSAVVMQRSWYAKALFPVHESFLMWEGYRKKPGKNDPPVDVGSPSELDKGFTVGTHNHFARSGEMVYLMLGAGTRNDPARRERIVNRLKAILTANTALGDLVGLIEETWLDLLAAEDGQKGNKAREGDTGTLGWLPDPDFPAFERFAEDVDALLRCRLDAVEVMQMFLHLIGFHVTQYLYRRALKLTTFEGDPRPTILVDASEAGEERAIRHASVLSFKRNQELIVKATKRRLATIFAEQLSRQADPELVLTDLFKVNFNKYWVRAEGHEAEWLDYVPTLSSADDRLVVARMLCATWEAESSGFDQHFLPVHRQIAREIGLVAPRTGNGQRYVLGDALLKALVLCNVKPGGELEYYGFAERLFDRYGLLVGPDELNRAAEWLQLYDVNRLYYQANSDAFRLKLKRAGLLTEYSDATAMVTNRTDPVA
ncbi:MAG TPA: hypothetical protein VGK74_17310 [Symbiobacteriaceae bacterium]|jgi:hypothetical protein